MVGRLRLTAQGHLIDLWDDERWRKPFLFSAGIHIAILLFALLPSSLFHFSRSVPEVYTVELFDLEEMAPEPEQAQEITRPETAPPAEQSQSTQPVLSTRTIPKAPTEIKLIRPRAIKRDVRLPPMDQSMVLAALERIQQQEKAAAEKEKALEAIRDSILTRESGASQATQAPTKPPVPGSTTSIGVSGAQLQGIAATTALRKYKAMVAVHIGRFWSLPEGQTWAKDLYASVIVKVRADGIVTSAELEEHSSNGQFDKYVMQTIEQASPLPPFPEEVQNAPLRLHFYPEGMR